MKKRLLTIILGSLSFLGFAQLSGTYTIDSGSPTSGTNFQTFSAAFSALTSQGVNGAVTINVAEGTYSEQVFLSFQTISGASASNTITIQSDPSNTSNPLWTSSSFPIYWNYCNFDYLTFDGIDLATTGTSYMVYINFGSMDDVQFNNCNFSGGSYQFYMRYLQGGGSIGWDNCLFDDFRFGGVYQFISYFPYLTVTIENSEFYNDGTGSYPYAIYLRNPGPGTKIANNNIELDGLSGGYAMYLYYVYANASNPAEIYNNIVNFTDPNDPFSQYGIYSLYGNYLNFHHNTIKTSNSYQFTRAAFMYATSTANNYEFKNNIVTTPSSSSYAFFGYTTGIDFDHNVWYQGGSNGEAYMWNGGTVYTSFSNWQSAVGSTNSVSTDPQFTATNNLTPQAQDANDIGTPLGILTDINGSTRSTTTPDAGAIEFSVPTNNATISDLIKPDAPLCSDDTSVIAVLKNTGLVPLTSCTLTYELNGTVQTNLVYSGSLAVGADTTLTMVSSTNFTSGDEIRVWSSMPNGVVDSSAMNDTVSTEIFQGLTGTYNIPSDYSTLVDAAADVMAKGVCGHVVMEISPGTYNEQFTLGEFLGASENATLTWTSTTGNSSDVDINFQTTGNVITLDGTDWVTIKDVTVRNTTTSTVGIGIRIEGEATNVMIDDCIVSTGDWQTTSSNLCPIYSTGNNHNLTITNNEILRGGYGLYISGSSSTNLQQNVVVNNNLMKNAYYMQSYLYYMDGFEFNNNVVTNDTNIYLFSYGIRMFYVSDFNVTGNYVGSDASWNGNPAYGGYAYPFYLYQCIGNNNPRSQVSNNCITAGRGGATLYGYYGMYSAYSGIFDFHNNSVSKVGGGTGYYGAYFRYGGLVSVMNNSFANYSNGAAMYADGFTVSESNYNNLYTTGSTLVTYGTSNLASLEDYQNATGFGMNSINTDPLWVDTLACVTCNDTLDNAGSNMSSAMYDIDSNMRSMTTPDIGAIEWVSPANFTLGGDSTYCADEVLIEAGPAQNVTWSVNGNSSNAPSLTLSGGTEATTYNVLVSIETEYCGSASDNALITLVPNANLDSNVHICADDDATLNPGGIASGSYTWSNGAMTQSITVDAPGSYTVTKDVMGCVSTATTDVTQSEAVEIIGTEVCSDDLPLSLDATIANGTTYAWSGGAAPTSAVNTFNDGGAYTVTATDALGCSSVDSFEVVVLEEPEATITTPSYSGFIYVFDASTSPFLTASSTVNWSFGAGASPATSTNVMETVVYPWSNPSNPATYSVSLEINNGCGVDIATQIIQPSLGVEDLKAGEFAIFPNPANDVVTVATKDVDAGNILILDMSGRTVAQSPMSAGSNNHEINVNGLAAGSYIVKVVTDANTQMKQLIVQ